MSEILSWLNTNAGAIQAGSTIVLVVVTAKYALDTNKIAGTAKRQIKQSEDELEQLREQTRVTREQLELEYEPNLVLNIRLNSPQSGDLMLTNLGRHIVHINGIICGKNLVLEEYGEINYIGMNNSVMQPGESRDVASLSTKRNESNTTISIHLAEVLEGKGASREGNAFDEVQIDFQYGTTSDLVHSHIFGVITYYSEHFSEVRVKLKKRTRAEATPLVKMES